MFPRLIDDNGLILNAILWLFVMIFFLVLSITFIKLVQLCFTCHYFFSRTLYQPVYKVYLAYQDYMRIAPVPADIINV
ncbi:E protein [NL63-related bat coronavirus]|uniref:Envelope small membrane protein n=1 Tax=NL63-related bat coronavirus TaxID=1920748 RepID=A0A1L2KGB6_9ALPC|nr:E protein [NL63-related bat coronavirus]APD51477.1 E protein [NL63-related bat coronavirus]